ncbi:nucleoporin Nup186/Nup192/Nup205 [Hyaloraphidium curvatum]|nr:nucleoporin Nup186/Nup192/Nup205 [Hyaloraphidium curvatum]
MPPKAALAAAGAEGAPPWSPDVFARLLDAVTDAFTSKSFGVLGAAKDAYKANRDRLRAGLAHPPRADAKRDEIAKHGKATVGGREYRGSAAFNYNVLCLSDLLHMDEDWAAAILFHAQSRIAEFGGRSLLATGLAMFHAERAAWVEVVISLVLGALDDRVPDESRQLFVHMLRPLMGDPVSGNGLLRTVLEGLDQVQGQLARLAQVVDAPAPAMPPNPQQTLLAAIGGAAVVEEHSALFEEQLRRLKYAACLLAEKTSLNYKDVVSLLKRLQSAQDAGDEYAASAWLSALMRQSSESTSPADESLAAMAGDRDFLMQANELVDGAGWRSQGMRLFAKMSWSTYLKGFQPIYLTLYDSIGLVQEKLDQGGQAAIAGDIVTFIRERLLQPAGTSDADPDTDLRAKFLLPNLRMLLEQFIQRFPRILRSLKVADDEAAQIASAQGRLQVSQSGGMVTAQSAISGGARPDFTNFVALISELYRGQVDAGWDFWNENRLVNFLKLAADSRSMVTRKEVLGMLGALASGPRSSEKAFNFLGGAQAMGFGGQGGYSSGLSWYTLFQALQTYAQLLSPANTAVGLPDEEVALVSCFLSVLTQVATYNAAARTILSQARGFDSLVILVTCGLPVSLKASLLDSLAAFCVGRGENIAERVFGLIETHQLLQTHGIPLNGQMTTGLVVDLEQIEVASMRYPATGAFVELLTTLMVTTGGVGPALDNLGSGRRKPGVWPYVDYVVDQVLLKLRSRSYVDPKERWKLQEKCFRFLETCLANMSFRVSGNQGRDRNEFLGKPGNADQIDVSAVLYHAGFQVMTKTLSGPKFRLLEELLDVLRGGVEAVNRNLLGTADYRTCCLHALRIAHKISENQRPFVDACSILSASGVEPPFASNLPSNITTLDQFMFYRNDVVAKLAGFVACTVDDEIGWLAVRLLHFISLAPDFGGPGQGGRAGAGASGGNRINRLVSVIRQSPDRDAIIQGFADRLDVEDAADDVAEPALDGPAEDGDQLVQRNVDGLGPDGRAKPKPSVRSAILDLLLDNLGPQVVAPSVAHLLLGFDVQRSLAHSTLLNPKKNPSVTLNSLHVIVDLIQRGTNEALSKVASWEQIIWIRQPLLAEKCYHLIYALCSDPQTSNATLQYLRAEDVLVKQLDLPPSAAFARELFSDDMDQGEEVAGEALMTLCRAWLLRTVALELRNLSQASENPALGKLLKVLYQVGSGQANGPNGSTPSSSGLPRMLELAQNFEMGTIELAPLPRGTRVSEDEASMYRYEDSRGCPVYDVPSLALLLTARRPEDRLGGGQTVQDREILQLLEVFVVRNRQYESQFARQLSMKAWAEIVEVSLSDECYPRIPGPEKHILVYDMCTAVLPRLAEDDTDPDIVEDLSRAVLSMVVKLGAKDSSDRGSGANGPNNALSLDMMATLVKQLIGVLTKSTLKSGAKGDLTSALLRFMQDIAMPPADARAAPGAKRGDSGEADDETVGRSSALAIRQTGTLATIYRLVDQTSARLVELLCSMALDAREDIWKATALAALDSVLGLYQSHTDNTERVVHFINQRNFIGLLVETIRRDDFALQQLVHTYEADSLNPLSLYLQKMSLLCRLCLKREGADKLVENGLIEALTDSRVLDMKPDVDLTPDSMEHAIGLAERFHRIFLPAVRLVSSILSRVGRDNVDAARRATAFIMGHQDVLLSILKDRTAAITLLNLEQLECITFLCSMLAGRSDFTARTGFLHFHLIGLLAKYSDTSRWMPRLRPVGSGQAERHAEPVAGSRGALTPFQRDASRVVRNICRNILSYCQNFADSRSDHTQTFVPVFALSTNIPDDISYAPATPTLGTLIQYTASATDDLAQALEDHKRYSAKVKDLSEGRTPAPADLDDVLGPKAVASLEPAEKNKAYGKEIRRMASDLTKDILALLYIIEHSLLQIYRHVEFCHAIVGGRADYPSAALATRRPFVGGAAEMEDLQRLRRELSSRPSTLRDVLDRLGRLDMSQDVGGRQLRSRNTFMQMLLRRSRDLLNLDSAGDMLED